MRSYVDVLVDVEKERKGNEMRLMK